VADCYTIPNYGELNTKTRLYCSDHAPEGYINVVSKKCLAPGCHRLSSYGPSGTKTREFCKSHKPTGYIDVAHKLCANKECGIRAGFNMPGYSPEYCAKHKKEGMVKNPTKIKADKNTCPFCETEIHYNAKYCESCKQYQKTNVTKKTHAKELEIKVLLEENEIKFIHDKVVESKCSRRRPDFQIPTKWGMIILEVDEFQHIRTSYTCECELTRMKQIYMDCGVKNLLFIRYNPDAYESTTTKFKAIKRKEYLLKFLKEKIETDNINFIAGSVYLFYNGFVPSVVEMEEFDPYKL
jgi:hypothetical protein